MRTTNYLFNIATIAAILTLSTSCRRTNYEPIGGYDPATDTEATDDTVSDQNRDTGVDIDTETDTNLNGDSDSHTDSQTDDPVDTNEEPDTAVAWDSETETTTEAKAETGCFAVGSGARHFESKHYKMQVSVGPGFTRSTSSSNFRLSHGSCNP